MPVSSGLGAVSEINEYANISFIDITDLLGLECPLDHCDGITSGQMLIPGVKEGQ